MNDRQRAIIDAATERLLPNVTGLGRDELGELLYQLVLDTQRPPPLAVPEVLRRSPAAGEVLPRCQRASWARARTMHDAE